MTVEEYRNFGQRCQMDSSFFVNQDDVPATPHEQSAVLVQKLNAFRNCVLAALPDREEARRPTRRKALVWRAAAMTISQIDAFMASHF